MITKEYIDLCKNPKVQGLREITTDKQGVRWITFKNGDIKYYTTAEDYVIVDAKEKGFRTYRYMIMLWLPTGDQLDDEIVKISRKKFDCYFQYEMCFITTEWYGSISYWKESEEYMKDCQKLRYAIQIKENPLIVKLKLLLSLLESEE